MLRLLRASSQFRSLPRATLQRFPLVSLIQPQRPTTARFLATERRIFVSEEQFNKDKSTIHVAAQNGKLDVLDKAVIDIISRDGSLAEIHWAKFFQAHHAAGTPIEQVVRDFPLEFIPSVRECTRAMLLAKRGAIEYIYSFMTHWQMKPNREGMTVVFSHFLSEGKLPQVLSSFETMLNWGYIPYIQQINIALEAHMRLQNWDSALQLYEEAKCNAINPNGKTYSLVIQVLTRTNNWEAADLVWKEHVAGKKTRMVDAYVPYMIQLTKTGRIDAAQEIWDSLLAEEIAPTAVVSAFMAEALQTAGRDNSGVIDYMIKNKLAIPKHLKATPSSQ